MAGGLLKTFGGILLALGIVVAVAGAAAAIVGYSQERDNRERGIFYDRSGSDENQQVMAAGLVALGIGIVAILLSIVFLVAGGARANNAIRRDIRQVASSVATPAAAATGAATSGKPSSAAMAPARRGRATRPAAGNGGVRAGVVAGVVALIALLVLTAFAINQGAIPGMDNGGTSAARDAQPLDEKAFDGSIEATFMQGSGSTATLGSDNSYAYTAPAGAARLVLNLTWSVPPAGGVDTLYLDVQDAAGETLVSAEGRGGLLLTITDPAILAQPLEIHVYPRGDGFVVQQEFHLQVTAWETA